MTQLATISADYTLRPSELAPVLALLVEARQATIVWGAPGTAKSMIAQQVAADACREYVDVRALLLDPVDLRGNPLARRRRPHPLGTAGLPSALGRHWALAHQPRRASVGRADGPGGLVPARARPEGPTPLSAGRASSTPSRPSVFSGTIMSRRACSGPRATRGPRSCGHARSRPSALCSAPSGRCCGRPSRRVTRPIVWCRLQGVSTVLIDLHTVRVWSEPEL